MEKEIKCSLKKHSEKKAITFCQECNKYMCNKCLQLHSDLFDNHLLLSLDKLNKDMFTGICKEENHSLKFEYFCYNHNQFCCEKCISQSKYKGKGNHFNCNIVPLEKIEARKRIELKGNISILKHFEKNINTNIEDLKRVIEKSYRDKENMKLKIQKIFTQIRNALNKREDQLLINIDKKFDRYLIKKELLKEGIDLPKKIKANLEKANIIDKEWAKNKLSLLINDCSKIENDLSKINYTYNEINSINSNN